MKKTHLLLILAPLFFLIIDCQKLFLYGVLPKKICKDIAYQTGVLKLEEERLDVRYLITVGNNKIDRDMEDSDMIIYLHGIGRTELDWVDEGSFGRQYYSVLDKNPYLKSLPVVSISFGLAYVIFNDLPEPFVADVEKAFIEKVVPYFQSKLGCYGKIYLIGHSLGGFNALTLSLRHPDVFPSVLVISPFILPYSPFQADFEYKARKAGLKDIEAKCYKSWFMTIYKNEENWIEYNPYDLIDKNMPKPSIFISSAKNDYPGFKNLIDCFLKKLNDKKIPYEYAESRIHKSTEDRLMVGFLKEIYKQKEIDFTLKLKKKKQAITP